MQSRGSRRIHLLVCNRPLAASLMVLLLAAGLRLGWMLIVPVAPVSDSTRYDFFAQRLARGLGYTEADGRATAYWPAGPSLLFSLVYRLTGPDSPHRLTGVALLNLAMGVASVALVIYLGLRWFGPRTGCLAGLILACWPSQIQFTTVIASETPMIFFMLAALALWTAGRPNLWLAAAGAGACLAAASMMRPTALLLPAVFAAGPLVQKPQRLRTLAAAGLMTGVMIVLISPWSLRNHRVFGEFVLISTNGGVNLWMGNNPHADGGYMEHPGRDFGGEVARDRELKREGLAYIRNEPGAFVTRSFLKLLRLHDRETIGVCWNQAGLQRRLEFAGRPAGAQVFTVLKAASSLYWWAVLGCAVLSALRLSAVSPGAASLAVLPWAYFAVLHAVTVIQDRYHFAAVPFVALLAALSWSRERARSRVTGSTGS